MLGGESLDFNSAAVIWARFGAGQGQDLFDGGDHDVGPVHLDTEWPGALDGVGRLRCVERAAISSCSVRDTA